jgi:hypothetical protein
MEGESFDKYRARLRREHRDLREKLKGNVVWLSSAIIEDKQDLEKPKRLRRLLKVRVQGTYRKEEA